MNEPLKSVLERRSTVVSLLVVIVLIEVFSAATIVLSFDSWQDRASFGDMFGAVNSLFSGLALAGVVYAILLQRQELALQRQELELTRRELERAADAQHASAKLLEDQLALSRESRAADEKRRNLEAAPLFQVKECSHSGKKMDFTLQNHGAPIRDLEFQAGPGISIQLQQSDLIGKGEDAKFTIFFDSHVQPFGFTLSFYDIYGSRRQVAIAFHPPNRRLTVSELSGGAPAN